MRLLVLAVVLTLATPVAFAQKPWAAGVSEKDQSAALELYQQANELFEQAQFAKAIEQYDAALKLWAHPAIYYNAAVCLINLERPVEAYEYMVKALAHGEAPLDEGLFQQGESYMKLLAGQVGELEIVCKEPDATVTLDGRPLFVAPGRETRRVRAGEPHQIVAKKSGFETETRTVHVPSLAKSPEKTTVTLDMRILEGSRWKPWAVVAAGAVVGAIGIPLYVGAVRNYDRSLEITNQVCSGPPIGGTGGYAGCESQDDLEARAASQGEPSPRELEDRARLQTIGAISAFAVGGATIAVGVWLVVKTQGKRSALTPTVGTDRVGLAWTARY